MPFAVIIDRDDDTRHAVLLALRGFGLDSIVFDDADDALAWHVASGVAPDVVAVGARALNSRSCDRLRALVRELSPPVIVVATPKERGLATRLFGPSRRVLFLDAPLDRRLLHSGLARLVEAPAALPCAPRAPAAVH